MKKPKLRTPDGKIQMRSIDDLLKEAASDETIANLPGSGKPLDLGSYFAPGEEFRVAGKILKENQVLPPHLQERKDAEALQEEAKRLLAEAEKDFPQLRKARIGDIEKLVRIFPDTVTCQDSLGLNTWPEDFPAPASKPYTLKDVQTMASEIAQNLARYNARVRNLNYRYLTCLGKAQENIQNYHKRQLLSSTLSPNYNYLAPIDLEAKKQEIQSKFPPLPELPADVVARITKWHKQVHPPIWKRILKR